MFPYLVLGIIYMIFFILNTLDAILSKTLEKEKFNSYKNFWRSLISAVLYFVGGIFYTYMYFNHKSSHVATHLIDAEM